MKIRNIFIFMIVFLFAFTMLMPVFATDESLTSDDIDDSTDEDITEEDLSEDECTDDDCYSITIIESLIINPEQVMDYSKMYHLATVTLNECSKVKWYLLKEDGSLFNGGIEKEHHDTTFEITWNALDVYGTHPAGSWNNPVSLRLSLVVIATSIFGEEEYAAGWFVYTWYDNDKPVNTTNTPQTQPTTTPTTPTTPSTPTTTTKPSDVPHTGL